MAFDAFLNIATIPGESTDAKHKGWIEILSYSMGVSQPSAGSRSSGGAITGQRCDHADFSVVKTLDKASPKLFFACCKGEHITTVKLELSRATGDKQKYMEYNMFDVLVSCVRPGGSAQGGEALPLEEVGFNYGKIEMVYTETDHATGKTKGAIKHFWSPVENMGS